jgi:hypothetical protein
VGGELAWKRFVLYLKASSNFYQRELTSDWKKARKGFKVKIYY